MKLFLRKASCGEKLKKLAERRGDSIEYFRKQILDHLDSMDDGKEEKSMQKAFSSQKFFSAMLRMEKGGKGLAVGTVREWKGKKFKKIAPGKWKPIYESENRGAKMAISAIKKKIAAAPDAQSMMQIILENRDRFSDKNGNPLPFVQELSKFIAEEQEKREEVVKQQEKETPKKAESETSSENSDFNNEKGKETISKWLSTQNLSKAKGKTREEIFSLFGNNYKPIAAVPVKYLEYLDKNVKSPIVYSGMGYFIDHAVNHHPEVNPVEYTKIPEILNNPDDVKLDDRNQNRTSLVFLKKYNKYGTVVISVDTTDTGKIVIHKSFFNPKKSPYPNLRSVRASSPDDAISSISHTDESVPGGKRISTLDDTSTVSPESGRKSSKELDENQGEPDDFAKIQVKYKAADFEEGDDDQIQVGKELISGTWKLVEADTPTASHDETSFHQTPGFPATDDGTTINDRDYGHDREAQEMVMEIGVDYDGRAVSVDNPVIVTKDGIVISGNNRTMSSKIAARKGTDKEYIEALKRKAKKFGFTPEQVGKFKHPRVIFETAENADYSTELFAKFNKSSKKAMSPIESAVKVSKVIKSDTVENIAGKMADYETLGELYADRNIINDIFNTLQQDTIVSAMDRPQYVTDGGITGAGKEFLETVLIGSVINESNIRGLNREGCKNIRQKLVRAITPLIENKGMGGYSITKELNEAVDIAMQIATQKDKFKSIDDYTSQKSLFGIEDDPVAVEIARRLEGTQKEFASFMQTMNGGLKHGANGESDIFFGGVESREDILGRMLNLKKAIGSVIDFFRNLRTGTGPHFIKKAVPVKGKNGETELSERWIAEQVSQKSLTYSGYPLQGRTKFHGMDISIENKKGSVRSGTDKDGKPWSQKMGWDYGYIRGTVGKDKDHVDCFLGPNKESDKVFVIHQVDPFTEGKPFDEDKVMLGWDNADEAKKAYLEQYNRPDFFGSMDEMSIDDFKEIAFDPENKGKKLRVSA